MLRGDVPVRVGGRALDILTALVRRPGEVVGKQELIAQVWPDTFVDDSNLKVNMNALRRALGDATGAPQYVATVIGRGYRFVAPLQVSSAAGPSLDTEAAAGHNLPAATTRIVGRREIIDAVGREFEEARLVTIVGPGGIGKSTVAIAVAEGWVGKAEDGVWFVDLSSLKDPSIVANAIATAIGLLAHSANMVAALCGFLRDRQVLLVLDSCEHVIDAVATDAAQILAEAPGARILATSREPLRLKGERVRRLPGLETPPAGAALTAAVAHSFAAVELFVERAREQMESFALTDAEAPLAAELCRRLDGMALAIELAATRIDAFGLQGLVGQIEDRFRLLSGHRGGAERHRTLAATIDWSYDLLSEDERRVMRWLSTFTATFSLEDAAEVAAEEGAVPAAMAGMVASLVAKSLLTPEIREAAVVYRQLDTTRAYAQGKLVEAGEEAAARRRHAAHALDFAERIGSDPAGLEVRFRLCGPKIDDIRAALSWAFSPAGEPRTGVRLTAAAIPHWKHLSLVEECRAAVERALGPDHAPHRGPREDLVLNLALGATLLHTRGPLAEVKSSLRKALAIAEAIGDADLQLECLRGLSEYELWTGDSAAAIAVAGKIDALEAKGAPAARGDADAQAGSALSWMGSLAAARHRLEGIVHRPVGAGPRVGAKRFEFDQRLTARGALATVLWLQGLPDQALETARRQLQEAEASEYAVSLCSALLHGSLIVSMYVRDYEAAWAYLDRGLAHATRHRLQIWKNMATCTRGRMELYASRRVDLAAYRAALAQVREGGFRMRYPNYLTNYGEALARQGDLEGGLAAIDEAILLSKSNGQVVGIPEILRIKGNVIRFEDPGSWRRASDIYAESIDCARRYGALSWELRTATSLVKLWREHGGDSEAEATLAATYARFGEGFTTGDLRRARALLETPPNA